ncbi:restriction endonuclease subunit S [Micromonospora haikouensis]|uniref:restriction endonuclease subunit S n=1 Tax=Micromonospora haikouensis TaxID=686309 RepID=UPI003691B3BD
MTDLPKGWASVSLGDVVTVNPRAFDRQPDDNDLVSLVPMAAVETESGLIDASRSVCYGDAKKRSLTPFQEGDVLFARVTPCMENGKIAVARGLVGGRGLGSTELFALRSGGAIEPDYLAYFLLQPRVREAAKKAMTGAVGLRRVPRSYLAELLLPLPPLIEQRRIVAALEASLSSVRSGQSRLRNAHAKARSLRRRLENLAVRGAVSPLGSSSDLPRGWRMATVGDLCWKIEYGTSAKTHPKNLESDVPVIRMGNVQDGNIVMDSLKYLPGGHPDVVSLMLEEGDVLFNRTNSAELVGKAAAFDVRLGSATFASYLIRCRTGGEVEASWLALVINSSLGRSYVRSVMSQQVGQANVNGRKLAAMPVPLPPLDEQRGILAALSTWRESIRGLAESVDFSTRKGNYLYRSFLTEAFAGRLVPQDPEDEPASELLARIKAERAATIPKQRTRSRCTPKELPAPATRVTGDDYQQETLPL